MAVTTKVTQYSITNTLRYKYVHKIKNLMFNLEIINIVLIYLLIK